MGAGAHRRRLCLLPLSNKLHRLLLADQLAAATCWAVPGLMDTAMAAQCLHFGKKS